MSGICFSNNMITYEYIEDTYVLFRELKKYINCILLLELSGLKFIV